VLLHLGGFDERYFAYLEDVDLALRIRLAGWRCLYVPAVVRHAGEGSSEQLSGAHHYYVARNTLLLAAKFFPLRWAGPVLYRQLSWLRHAGRRGWLGPHLRGLTAALPMLPAVLRARRVALAAARVTIDAAVPERPYRGPLAGGHASSPE
jgi:GT2 family glycosyltransferase